MSHNREANKWNAIEFYRTAYVGEPAEAVRRYVLAEYIQHNPAVGNGTKASSGTSKRWPETTPTRASKSCERLRKAIWSPFIRIRSDLQATSTSPWTSSDSMTTARSSNTGTRSNRCRPKRRAASHVALCVRAWGHSFALESIPAALCDILSPGIFMALWDTFRAAFRCLGMPLLVRDSVADTTGKAS